MLLHLAVGKGHRGLRHQSRHLRRHIPYIVHPIVHVVDLASSGQLSGYGLPHHLLVILADKGLYGQPVLRGFLQHAHVPDSDQAHMQGSGNGSGRQSQHIHIFLQLLDLFLVGHPEALLLVDDQKPQILELYVLRQNPVGADNDVHLPLLQIRQRLFDLPRRPETAHEIHPHREILHPLDKRRVMLLGQNGGGNQIHHLLALLHRLEGRPYGDLRLAVAHVPADQAVHHLAALHVRLGVRNGSQLIFRLLKGKHLLEFFLPYRVLLEPIAFALLAQGVQLHQVAGHLTDRASDLGLGALPFLGTQTV